MIANQIAESDISRHILLQILYCLDFSVRLVTSLTG